jgi:hypothetical protein
VGSEGINRVCAIAPIVMSALAVMLLVFAFVTGWGQGHGDEGAAARIWQLLIAGQAPFVLGFLATADWDRWQRVAGPFALQVGALAVALFPVAYFRL